MSERKQALVELRDKVKAEDAFRHDAPQRASRTAEYECLGGYYQDNMAYGAFHGSLDAAKALHEAVLPDEGWEIARTAKYPGMIPGSSQYPFRAYVGWSRGHYGEAENPARAWLLAILEALIAKEDAG